MAYKPGDVTCLDPKIPETLHLAAERTVVKEGEAFTLHPGDFALGSTIETVSIPNDLVGLVDVKDRIIEEAGKTLSPRERATLIVKVGQKLKKAFPHTAEGGIAAFRAERQAGLKAFLKMDDARAKKVFAEMDTFHAQRKDVRTQRRELVDSLAGALKGGENGKIIEPGKSAESPMVHSIAWVGDEDYWMPPKDNKAGIPQLTKEQVRLIRAWIDQGAK